MMVNFPIRFKNPWFWVGVVSVALTAIGLDPSMFTSWGALYDAVIDVLGNPFQLVTMALAILAVFIDPTTTGVQDSKRVMSYQKPNKEGE